MTSPWNRQLPEPGATPELVSLGLTEGLLGARSLDGRTHVLVRSFRVFDCPVAGEVFTLDVANCCRSGGRWILEGRPHSPRLDVDALALEHLAVFDRGDYWELESVVPEVPGVSSPDRSAIREILRFKEGGERDLAENLAGEILARDVRCLEAHVLLGDLFRDGPLETRWTERALRHYAVGVAIAEDSLGDSFRGTLPWRFRANRPYLRCLYWKARCLEKVGDAGPAGEVFERLLTVAPEDPLRVRETVGRVSPN